jgi:dolichol-phosphate mannosyltransferase
MFPMTGPRPSLRDKGWIMATNSPQLSVVIPVFNERGNLPPLVDEIDLALADRLGFEIIVVDDGSTDGTDEEVEQISARTSFTRLIRHGRTRGQSAAIRTGVKAAAAPVVAVLDGDGQNDPTDIPKLFGPLMIMPEVRMVVGQRERRNDSWIRRMSSRIANNVRNAVLKDGIRDTGCGLKVFYRDDFIDLPAFDHMHRFLPALMQRSGAAVHTVPVNHRPRLNGTSKYGIGNRLWVGITDLIGVMWLQKRRL